MSNAAVRELVITRVFDAPREMVYRAFVDPDQVAQWFSPTGWSVPRETVDLDVRVGGRQRFTMVDDDNPDSTSPVNATFTEVVENELLVATEEFTADGGETGLFTSRVEFHDEGGKTRLVIRQSPSDPESGAREGWNGAFAKLDALLAG